MKKKERNQLYKWYLRSDYWPDAKTKRNGIFLNKFIYFLLVLISFILISILNAFEVNINEKLFNPYFNSIEANCIGVDGFDEQNLINSFPQLDFDPTYLEVIYFESLKLKESKRLNGISLKDDHPYFKSLDREGNPIWASHEEMTANKGIIFSVEGLKKLELATKELLASEVINLKIVKLRGLKLEEMVSVSKVVKTLPNGKDFLMPVDYKEYFIKSNIVKSKQEEEKSSFIAIVDDIKDPQFIDVLINGIQSFFNEKGVVTYSTQSLSNSSEIMIDFEDAKFFPTQMQKFISLINDQINDDLRSGSKMALQEENFENSISNENLDKYYKDWVYFTITPRDFDRDEIYSYSDSIYSIYPIYIDTKSLDTVFFLEKINSTIDIFKIFIFMFILISSIILNYKILQFHLHQRKKNIMYLNAIGIPKSIFNRIYVFQAIVETAVVCLISLVMIYLIQNLFGAELFMFKFDKKIILFIALMLISMISIYLYSIRSLLKRDFRSVFD